jgi:hypothetical protein
MAFPGFASRNRQIKATELCLTVCTQDLTVIDPGLVELTSFLYRLIGVDHY